MIELIILIVVFLLVLAGVWYGLNNSSFGKKHFCYKDGNSLYNCGKNISVCTTKDSNAQKLCDSINNTYEENYGGGYTQYF